MASRRSSIRRINNGGTATVTTNASAGSLTLGFGNALSGTVIVNGGALTTSTGTFGINAGASTFGAGTLDVRTGCNHFNTGLFWQEQRPGNAAAERRHAHRHDQHQFRGAGFGNCRRHLRRLRAADRGRVRYGRQRRQEHAARLAGCRQQQQQRHLHVAGRHAEPAFGQQRWNDSRGRWTRHLSDVRWNAHCRSGNQLWTKSWLGLRRFFRG